jgi:Holliday junction resolvasome RuvABC DNA-binding subunit
MLKNSEVPNLDLSTNNNIKEDALIALVSLGFNKNVVLKALQTIKSNNNEELTVEYYIKNALKVL